LLVLFVGTNGGVSLAGTLASAVGGAIVGLAYYLVVLAAAYGSVNNSDTPPAQWPLLIVTALAGLIGSLIDSLLGATLQYSGELLYTPSLAGHFGIVRSVRSLSVCPMVQLPRLLARWLPAA